MTVDTREWVKKAEDDFQGALFLQKSPNRLHDQVCFHCQQCAEKYLKALLEENKQSIPKTHNLVKLLQKVLIVYPQLRVNRRGLDFLTRIAVETRYPNEFANKRQALAAIRWATKIRAQVRTILKLKP